MLGKLRDAISDAINHLENATKVLKNRDDKDLMDLVWKAAAETEYALFLFSLLHKRELEESTQEFEMYPKNVELGPSLISAQDLLKKSKSLMNLGDLNEARKKTRVARVYLLKVWTKLQKKKRSRPLPHKS